MILDLFDLNRQFGKIVFKSAPSAPPAPDPVKISEAQTVANKETAITQAFLNNVSEFGPTGSRVFTPTFTQLPDSLGGFGGSGEPIQDGADGGFSGIFRQAFEGDQAGGDVSGPGGFLGFEARTTLTPEAQAAFEAQQAVTRGTSELAASQIGRVSEAVSDPFSFGGLPAAPQADDEARQRTEQALFDRQRKFLDPRFEQEQRDLETQLVNQGIPRDSDAFRQEMDNFSRRKESAFADARNQAIVGGGGEQTRTFGLESAARERGIQERAFERNIPLNEIAALLGTGSINLPQFGAPPQTAVAGTDVIGANALQQQALQNAFNAQSRFAASGNQALAGLAGAGLGAGATFFGR